MNEQQIQQLMQKLRELEKTYSENDLPLTALKIAGSRLDDVRFSTDNAGIDGLLRKADKSLRQAEDVAKLYMNERITEACDTLHKMRMELHQDYPHHYLS